MTAATDQAMLTSHKGGAAWPNLDARDTDRYGIYFRPDPRTCRTQIELHQILQRQYGLVAGAAFPPHATLLGNVAISCGEDELVQRVEQAAARFGPIPVHNRGLAKMGAGIACDVHYTPTGSVNEQLVDLAVLVEANLEGVRRRTDSDYLTGHTSAEQFHAHLTIAGQDFALRPDLFDEVSDYLTELEPRFTQNFTVDTVSLYRFRSSHWASQWWDDMTWQHLKSWKLH